MKKIKCSVCKKNIYRWNYQIKNQKDFYCDEHKKLINKGKHNSILTEFKKGIHYAINTEFKQGQPKSENWYRSVKNRIPWNKGKEMDIKMKKKLSVIRKGNHYSPQTEFKKGLIPWNKNKPHLAGDKHPNWKGGITSRNRRLRGIIEYCIWRKAVRKRDKYICQICGENNSQDVDHYPIPFFQLIEEAIKIFGNEVEELRKYEKFWDINNGRTLCKKCHALFGWRFIRKQTQDFVYWPRYL